MSTYGYIDVIAQVTSHFDDTMPEEILRDPVIQAGIIRLAMATADEQEAARTETLSLPYMRTEPDFLPTLERFAIFINYALMYKINLPDWGDADMAARYAANIGAYVHKIVADYQLSPTSPGHITHDEFMEIIRNNPVRPDASKAGPFVVNANKSDVDTLLENLGIKQSSSGFGRGGDKQQS